ncbi:MAG TPA: hypothetical protein VFX03_07735, partial [Thermomicrobiales bacterium]|nr:hypothetical protein [Thermomicrobiales bacterium]
MTDQMRSTGKRESRDTPLSRREVMRGAAALGAATAAIRFGGIATMAATRQAPAFIRAQDAVTVEVWDQQQSDKSILDAYNQALTAFQKDNPNITVKVTTFPYAQYRDKLL